MAPKSFSFELAAMSPYNDAEIAPRSVGRGPFVLGALVLLLVFVVVAGPLNFARARRDGRPEGAIFRLIWVTALAFVLVCLVGAGARSCSHRPRPEQVSLRSPSAAGDLRG